MTAKDKHNTFEASTGIMSNPSTDIPAPFLSNDLRITYRTLSVQIDHPNPTTSSETAVKLRDIDVHTWPVADVFSRFATHPTGGLAAEIVERRSLTGKNKISPPPTRYARQAAGYVFGGFNFLMWIAFVVILLSWRPLGNESAAGPQVFNLGVAVLLFAVIVVSSIFYAWVDYNASRIMRSIRSLIAQEAYVIRSSLTQLVSSESIVVGDLVTLSAGQRVPADIRIVEASSDLSFDRMLLTGEGESVEGCVDMTDANVLETRNLAFASTFVVQGSAKGVVFAIGDKTVMGRIVHLSGQHKPGMTTMQREIWYFTRIISTLAFSLFALSMIFWAAYTRQVHPGFAGPADAIINSIGCLTAFVPQGLPVCVALSLTIIAKRMAAHHVLVKNLSTIETLGCMSILCSDKTGTLTQGRMTVEACAVADVVVDADDAQKSKHAAMSSLYAVATLGNGATFDQTTMELPIDERTVKGDATDAAILRFATAHPDAGSLVASHQELFEIPFNSKNKWMMTVQRHLDDPTTNPTTMYVKGAPDVLYPLCSTMLTPDGKVVPFEGANYDAVLATQAKWSALGQRVLALCLRPVTSPEKIDYTVTANAQNKLKAQMMNGLTLVGLVAIRDPPRPDVPAAITAMRRAHVRVLMVTGDFQVTATAIGKQIGLITNEHIDTLAELRANAEARERFAQAEMSEIKPADSDPVRSLVLTGQEVEGLNSEEWNMAFGFYTEIVFARTTPDQKLQIVEEAKKRGDNVVGVTGDGVNDAAALKAADVGVAMGSGSDVAKEAAAMVLLNNEFSSILVGIENGRLVFDNIKKVILYLMPAGTYTEFIAVLSNVFFGMQLPLSSFLQLLFCIGNDVAMSASLMFEKPEADLMNRKPRNARTDRLANRNFFVQIYLFIGPMMWLSAMGMWFLWMSTRDIYFNDLVLAFERWGKLNDDGGFHAALVYDVNVGNCIYYVTMLFLQFGGLMAARNRRMSTFHANPFSGPRRNGAIGVSMLVSLSIALVVLYVPAFNNVFATTPIPVMYWFIPMALGVGVLSMDEARKAVVRAYPRSVVARLAW
ncbi:calcium ATPase transmembrane domain M-containing protein [Fimicolochytrium jonesii]|uniref:calcium ATPase transmembrane domain M-containing protein n=1 Tax=Fimicolochytrium jonesii TaxID=1396493 RepID=UPI0022FE55B5|nr:calcium ATPase transmembrane domain M-containing protein [Fimicolochytrium jonesii]KAI8817013.1 calcium ATPase transmembrane domain M-containing protein [Fimicolochytrium jonesii]